LNDIEGKPLSLGLLVEGAQLLQRSAESQLERLREHTLSLDEVVRDEIRRTLIEEFQGLMHEVQRAAQSLRALQRAANLRTIWLGALLALAFGAAPLLAVRLWLPSEAKLAELSAERDRLTENLNTLTRQGARVDLRHCGDSRLCVRIDVRAPKFGAAQDYYVVAGY
jgi:hypothetical protein